jgi:hypothetical protein
MRCGKPVCTKLAQDPRVYYLVIGCYCYVDAVTVGLHPLSGSCPLQVIPSQGMAAPDSLAQKHRRRLLPHERELLDSGELIDVSHPRASSIWLKRGAGDPLGHSAANKDEAAGADDRSNGEAALRVRVYRPMGDAECAYLREHNQLPDTQPYQTIVEGMAPRLPLPSLSLPTPPAHVR